MNYDIVIQWSTTQLSEKENKELSGVIKSTHTYHIANLVKMN